MRHLAPLDPAVDIRHNDDDATDAPCPANSLQFSSMSLPLHVSTLLNITNHAHIELVLPGLLM